MKYSLRAGPSRLVGSLVSMAFMFLLLPGTASAQRRDPSADARMMDHFSKKTLSCAPKAPIETEFGFDSPPSPGVPARLVFRVMSIEPGKDADINFTLPPQVKLVNGRLSDSGTLDAKKAYVFTADVVITGTGHFEINASAIAGMKEARFGHRETLYIDNDGSSISVTNKRPIKNTVGAAPTKMGTGVNEVITDDLLDPKWGTPPAKEGTYGEQTEEANGTAWLSHGPAVLNPLAMPKAKAPFGNVTCSGTWRYRHGDGTLHAGYGTQVNFWDDDTFSGDDLMASTVVADDGSFSATFDNNDPEGGTTDLYVEFRTSNGVLNVHSNAGLSATFSTATAVLQNNIPDGTFNVGGWYADWGTNGTADDNERAWEVCDYMTRAWSHANYGLGYGPHFTQIQWYAGSTDGTYYQPSEDQIHCSELDYNSPDVFMHEFGHNVMDSVYAEVYIPNSGGNHWFTNHYNPALAMSEGWATWYSCSAQGNDWIYNDNNPGNLITFDCDTNWDGAGAGNGNSDNASTGASQGYDTESCVLACLLDLDDGRNDPTDPYDWTSLGDTQIWDITRYCDPPGANPHVYSFQQFYDGWFARGWPYHPQLNGQMHNHGMDQGIAKPFLGLYSGVSVYGGTWVYGGYGRGSYYVKNYGSVNYNLNRCYVWLRGPAGEDIGQFGSDWDGTPVASGATRSVWISANQTGYNPGAPNFVYGTYSITAGHYRSDNAWQLLEPAEAGTATTVFRNVVRDTTGPNYCTAADDGYIQNSASTLHVHATAADYDSSIKGYWTRVGTAAGLGDEQDWVFHDANDQTTFDYTITGLSMNANTTYYVTIVARNIENQDTWAYTDGIIAWDATPPGPVGVTDDGVWTANASQLHFVATASESDGAILGYWTRLGTGPGSGDLQDWVWNPTGDVDSFEQTIGSLSMTVGQTYYITVVARNYSGLDTWGYSDGIRVVNTPHTLTVNSSPNPGVNVTVPNDLNGAGAGTTNFTRLYEGGTTVSINVPAQVGTMLFDHVEVDGAAHTGPLVMDADHTINVVYVQGYSVSIQSTNPNSGVFITVWNNDYYNRIGGNTTFSRMYKVGKPCSMTAPNQVGSNWFDHWVLDGISQAVGVRTVNMVMNSNHTARAVYASGRTLTVNSTNPSSGVPITVWLTDKLGQGNGSTSFTRQYKQGANVPLTAPAVVGTSYFLRWDLNGAPWQTTATVTVPMGATDQTVNAVYAVGTVISVTASEAATPITVFIKDRANLGNGNTDFTRLYTTGTMVSFQCPATSNGKAFVRWDKDGSPVSGTSRTLKFLADADHTIRAVYAP